MSYDVKVPKNAEPLFPEECIGCGTSNPDGVFVLKSPFGAFGTPYRWWLRYSASIPCCPICREDLRKRRLSRYFVRLALGVLGLALAHFVFQFQKPLIAWKYAGLSLICALAGSAVWEARDPLVVEVGEDRNWAEYSFKDRGYATKFALLNGTEVEG